MGSEVVDSEAEEEVSVAGHEVVSVLLMKDVRCGIRRYANAWISRGHGEEATWISSQIGRPRCEFPLVSLDELSRLPHSLVMQDFHVANDLPALAFAIKRDWVDGNQGVFEGFAIG